MVANVEDYRKVQLTGRSTLIVSLPRMWAERKGVGRGSALYVSENEEGNLVLSPRKVEKRAVEYELEASGDVGSVLQKIVSCYVSGAGTIVLKRGMAGVAAEEARRRLSGLEIVEEEKDRIKLRIIDFGDELDVDKVVEREFKVTLKMLRLAKSVFEGNLGAIEEVMEREKDVDRLYLLLLRRFVVRPSIKPEGIFKVLAAKIIERVGDHTEQMCRRVAPNKHVASLIEKTAEAYSSSTKVFLGETSAREEPQKMLAELENGMARWLGRATASESEKRAKIIKSVFGDCTEIVKHSRGLFELSMDIRAVGGNLAGLRKKEGTGKETQG